jgi:hypothetical protein
LFRKQNLKNYAEEKPKFSETKTARISIHQEERVHVQALIGLMFLAPTLAEGALRFGPPEYFSVVLLGLIHRGTADEAHALVDAVDALTGKAKVGDRVVVIGGGTVGLETAEYLALTANER